MYTVTATVEGKTLCLHDDSVEDKRVKLLEPTLELEKNTAGKFTFKLAPTNQGYSEYTFVQKIMTGMKDGVPITKDITTTLDMVSRMRSTIRIYRDGLEIWEGRVLSEEKDWWNLRTITCEGEFAYLNDACQDLKRYSDMTLSQFLDTVLNVYNAKVDDSKKFYKGAVTVDSAAQSIGWRDTKYENTMETINNLLTDFGGIMRIRKYTTPATEYDLLTEKPSDWSYNYAAYYTRSGEYPNYSYEHVADQTSPEFKEKTYYKQSTREAGKRYLDWLEDYPNVSAQTIDFGKNLLDFKCTWDLSKLCTVLLPTGKVLEDAGQDQIGDVLKCIGTGLHDNDPKPTPGKILELGDEYFLLDEEPSGWSSQYTQYYTRSGSDPNYTYTSVPEQEEPPEFQTDTYYRRSEGTGPVVVTDVPTLQGYKIATYNVTSDPVDPSYIYLSCRLHGGYVCFVAYDGQGAGGAQLNYMTLTQDTGYEFKDLIDQKIELPAGTKSIQVCSFGDDIPLAVKSCNKAKHTTVTGETLSPVGSSTGKVLYFNESDTVDLEDAPSEYHTAVYNVSSSSPNLTKVYISCRLNGNVGSTSNLVTWVTKTEEDGFGDQRSWHIAQPSGTSSFEDFVEQEVELPADTRSLIVCSYGQGIPISVKKDVKTEVDESDAPLGAYLTVEECNSDPGWHTKGSPYVVYQEMVAKYGWIERQINLEEIEDKDQLYSTAKKYLQESMFDEMEIEVSAIDLKALGVNTSYINMLDKVKVKSEPHGLDKYFPVNKMSIPLLDLDNMKITLGTTTTNSLTDVNNTLNADVIKKITVTSSETLDNAKKDAASLIGMATNGYISFINDEEGNPKELVISNTKDPTECTGCWIWNVNGLGHADHYPLVAGDMVNVAMTMDGSIVADRITTGVMTAILLRGCTAIFGGMDGTDGSVLVKSGNPGDPNGDYCVSMQHGGMHFGKLTAVTDASAGLHVASGTSGSYTMTDFAKMQSDKVYAARTGAVNGLVVDSKVLAFDIEELWVSSNSSFSGQGGGTNATAGLDDYSTTGRSQIEDGDAGPFWLLMDDNGSPGSTYWGPIFFRHGIAIGDYRTNNNNNNS